MLLTKSLLVSRMATRQLLKCHRLQHQRRQPTSMAHKEQQKPRHLRKLLQKQHRQHYSPTPTISRLPGYPPKSPQPPRLNARGARSSRNPLHRFVKVMTSLARPCRLRRRARIRGAASGCVRGRWGRVEIKSAGRNGGVRLSYGARTGVARRHELE